MKYFYSVAVLLLICFSLFGQNYTRDVGLRLGHGFLGSYRQFYKENMAIEGLGGFRNNGITLTGLKEHFIPVFSDRSPNFKLFYGYGIHAGFSYTNKYRVLNREYRHEYKFTPLFGVDGIMGIEYYLPEVPILLSADFKPYLEFSLQKFVNIRLFELSFSIKYRL